MDTCEIFRDMLTNRLRDATPYGVSDFEINEAVENELEKMSLKQQRQWVEEELQGIGNVIWVNNAYTGRKWSIAFHFNEEVSN